MTGSSIKYLTKEGFRNVWTNRMMSIASICVLMSCLVLIGTAGMIFLNIDSLLEKVEDENVIMVFAMEDATDQQLDEMEKQIKQIDNVGRVDFVPKEVAFEEQLATMGDAQAELFKNVSNDNPLPDAYKVTVDNLDLFDQTVEQLNNIENVDIIRENKDLAQKLVAIRQGITVISIVIVGVLFLISLFIISNTIRLTVYSRRLEISIMKSVGATNNFVRFPFIIEGMILGVISGVFGLGLVWGLYQLAVSQFGDVLKTLNLKAVPFTEYALLMLGVFILIGIVCGVGGSLVTMRKYLNKEGSEISNV